MFVSENLGRVLKAESDATINKVAKLVSGATDHFKKIDAQERARQAYEFMDKALRFDLNENPHRPACGKGCAYCCHMSVDVFEDEANLIVGMIESGQVKIDMDELSLQKDMDRNDFKQNPRPCLFLKQDECQIYENRPIACRKYYVTGRRRNCLLRPGKAKTVRILFLPNAEIIYSALTNATPLEGNSTLAYLIDKKLNAPK